MKTSTTEGFERNSVNIQVPIDSVLLDGENQQGLEVKIREGLIISKYLDSEISIGKVAELMSMKVEEAMEWLHQKGIHTSRLMTPELERTKERNFQRMMKRLKASKKTVSTS